MKKIFQQNKFTVFFALGIILVVAIFLLVWFNRSPSSEYILEPEDAVGLPAGVLAGEREPTEEEIEAWLSSLPWTMSFRSVDELLWLHYLLDGDEDTFLEFLHTTGDGGHQLRTREDALALFAALGQAYLPIDTNWSGLVYDNSKREISIIYFDEGFVYSINICLDEEHFYSFIQPYEEAGREFIDITNELASRPRGEQIVDSSFRVGNGVQVTSLGDEPESETHTFTLNINDINMWMLFVNAPGKSTVFEILANLEFARGMSAWEVTSY